MKNNILFLIIFLLSNSLYCQITDNEKKLEVNVECRIENRNYDSITISVENENDTLIIKSKKAKFFLVYNKDYLIKFQKVGMETKIVKITTKNISLDRWKIGFGPINFMVQLFPALENEYFAREVVSWRYSETYNTFVYETLYHTLKKEISKINDSIFLIEEIDYKNRVIIRGHLSSVDPEIKDGEFRFYDKNGELEAKGEYSSNVPVGIWLYFNKNGEISQEIDYEKTLNFLMNDSIIFPDTINSALIKKPKFKNENARSFSDYLENNLHYPIYPLKRNISDTVLVSFIIDTNGNTRNLKILSSSGNLDLNMEALRLISESPKWISGELKKKKISVPMTFTIIFNKNKPNR